MEEYSKCMTLPRADYEALHTQIAQLRACVARAVAMTEESWGELTYRERSMLKPTLDQWRRALAPNAELSGSPKTGPG